ncbi:MAG: hypothetical protein ABSB81_11645 [Halobacteriota archaeon]|jgi:hypothetical protein
MLKDAVKPVRISGCTPAQERKIQERIKIAWLKTEFFLGIQIDRFEPGVLAMTRGIAEARRRGIINVGALFKRHFSGDYGEIHDEDKKANELSIKEGSCIVSGYDTDAGRVLIITAPESERTILPDYVEGHRAFTTMLLAEEYLDGLRAPEGFVVSEEDHDTWNRTRKM